MASGNRSAFWHLTLGLLACALSTTVAAQPKGVAIELNKAETSARGCTAAFVIANRTGQTLDRFSIELYLFDAAGVLSERLIVDLAPLPRGRTRIAGFDLSTSPCPAIGRLLVHDIPDCRAEATGEPVDCIGGLSVSSKSRIPLDK